MWFIYGKDRVVELFKRDIERPMLFQGGVDGIKSGAVCDPHCSLWWSVGEFRLPFG